MIKILSDMMSYEIGGSVADNGWLFKNRSMLEEHVHEDMRFNNILPVLDLNVDMTIAYDKKGQFFRFNLKCMGYRVQDASEYAGILIKDGVALSLDGSKVEICDGL